MTIRQSTPFLALCLTAVPLALAAGSVPVVAQALVLDDTRVERVLGQRPTPTMSLAPGSQVRLEGRSTLGGWTCTGTQMEARVFALRPVASGGGALGELTLPVSGLDCGDRRMEADLRAALKADSHPRIGVRVLEVRVREEGGGRLAGVAAATIAMAGAVRQVQIDVTGHRTADGGLAMSGQLPLRMTDFGVRPPTGLLGLIRAHDQVRVRFDLRATPDMLDRLGIRP